MAFSLPSATTSASTSNALAVDARSLNALKYQAGQNDPQAAKEAAKQFESLFMREMIKSMREATMKSGLLDGAESNLANDMFDQQLSVQMSGMPGGLSEAIQRQLAQKMGGGADPDLVPGSTLSMDVNRLRSSAPRPASVPGDPKAQAPKGRDNFVQHHRAAAERVAQESGIPANFMLGQAGHETGWGKSEIRSKGGDNSFNLFGIKAGKGWTGKVAEITTTEYINGTPRKVTAKFRAYDSYEDSFKDYARLINDNPRYEKARGKTHSAVAYASELQKAGYATDPQYATKLSRAIHSTANVAPLNMARNATQNQA
ncbi:flagellar assembly peptidoglycan hydrolase FlgJ [Paracidovorax wautersii]|uniref:Peptidoglycan hydrolase FlgJ n=1 Tax=Paracidovorax wautersii TaxID=1177982 RepID=A0ABU1IA51_9BURK|nr:flagellar assembly peptidoglycan hydrolase FlgJ [Paracidovorax wautersii]MDR6214087.1 flagellar protein FlgJ [Paracidovorax wautersii]